MNKATHTPGPWVAEIWSSLAQAREDHNGFFWARGGDPFHGGPVGYVWQQPSPGVTTGLPGSIEVSAADAYLIASAPDLLLALKEIVAAWRSIPEGGQVNEEMNSDHLWEQADAAISAAEGD